MIPRISILIFLFISSCFLHSQTDTVTVGNVKIKVVTKTAINSDYEKIDTILYFYKLQNGVQKYLLKHYKYTWSADCNNEFWDKGSYEVKNDSLIFYTNYHQKGTESGLRDPIPEKRMQIYKVQNDGKVIEIYDKEFHGYSGKWENVPDGK